MDNPVHATENESLNVVVEQELRHPASWVWKAITDKEQMKEWYFKLDDFKPEVGFEFRFPGQGHKGAQYMHVCRVTEVVFEKKVSYSWQYENINGYSLVSFELVEIEGDITKLLLTHEGLESFPRNNADFARESFAEGWKYIIGKSLPEYLESNNKT